MDTGGIKSFAPAVRRQLMEAVTRKLDFVLSAKTPDYLTTFATQVAALKKLEKSDRTGLIERVAYTWFNRLAALRYLDARGWHPFRARILTSATPDETQPEILKLMRTGALPEELKPFTDPERLNHLLDGKIPSPDPQGEVYRHLVLAACRFYNALLPSLFERLDDETELLLPDDLLTEHSVVDGFRSEISDADCQEVEVLGWLYQFYISEKKAAIMKLEGSVPTEDVPARTQLFTPHWIVRYLVENSLGRLWLLNRPQSMLREKMPYYIEGDAETDFLRINRPEDIRLIDPAVGSGHMLTYAFDLLYAIYEEDGYGPTDIPGLILTHNLYGVEICPRAAQLASLALVLKAREKANRFLTPERLVQPNIMALQDISFEERELQEYIQALNLGALFNEPVRQLLRQFEHATTFGSLIQPAINEASIQELRRTIAAKDIGQQLFLHETHSKVQKVLEQAEYLSQRYQLAATNPPYMGGDSMNSLLRTFSKRFYEDSKSDLFSMFIARAASVVVIRGWYAMVTMQSWMFLSSYQKLRENILSSQSLKTLIQIGYNSFPELNSKVAQACAFVLENAPRTIKAICINLNDVPQSADKEEIFHAKLRSDTVFRVSQADFKKIEGSPLAYWASLTQRNAFNDNSSLAEKADVVCGMTTGDNNKFVRRWSEISFKKFGHSHAWKTEVERLQYKWFPYNKGGDFRKWYGNNLEVVNWERDGRDIIQSGRASTRAKDKYFKPAVTWSFISSASFGVRFSDNRAIFDMAGCSAFSDKLDLFFMTALLCSLPVHEFLKLLNPTLNFQVGNVGAVPVPTVNIETDRRIYEIAKEAINFARVDWNNFETSWDFQDLPLLRSEIKGKDLQKSWQNWKAYCDNGISRMRELETENNRLFIAAYGLQDELKPEVHEEEITLARSDLRKDVVAFLSYAVGCMMGRYSLDAPGLILANAGDTVEPYLAKMSKSLDQLRFPPDEDGIIPVLDGEWFEDDIVARTREFLRVTFGEVSLNENLRFIEEALGKDLRKYFMNDFYKDHLQTYKKRPIYWMVQSPKKGFSALIYLHRYTKDMMNLLLNNYLREYQVKMRTQLGHLAQLQSNEGASARDKTSARKEADKLAKTIHECEEWERQVMLPLAQARIELDLDDGVKANYLKLGEALAPISGFAATEE